MISEPEPGPSTKHRLVRYLYIAFFVISTGATTFFLSLRGFIALEPITALLAGLIVGFALVIFQLTYLRFIGNSVRRLHNRDPDIV